MESMLAVFSNTMSYFFHNDQVWYSLLHQWPGLKHKEKSACLIIPIRVLSLPQCVKLRFLPRNRPWAKCSPTFCNRILKVVSIRKLISRASLEPCPVYFLNFCSSTQSCLLSSPCLFHTISSLSVQTPPTVKASGAHHGLSPLPRVLWYPVFNSETSPSNLFLCFSLPLYCHLCLCLKTFPSHICIQNRTPNFLKRKNAGLLTPLD